MPAGMEKWIIFIGLSIPVIFFSRRTLMNIKSHGLYRFFSWECILWLFANNCIYWFKAPWSIHQMFSWIFLIISGYYVIAGTWRLKREGKAGDERRSAELFRFEKTTRLVDNGIFKYVRHPLYASLLFLSWGIYLKQPDWILLIFAVLSSTFLYITAVQDEKECLIFFGGSYREYMKKSKRFIPFIF